MMIARFLDIVTEQELQHLRAVRWGDRPHPLSVLLGDLERPSQTATNTAMAAQYVLGTNPTWMASLKPRLLDTTDPANAAGALAELRAYGALLEAGFHVTPGEPDAKHRTRPEFIVRAGDEDAVTVEVYARQIAASTQAKLDDHKVQTQAALQGFREELQREGKETGVFVGEPIEVAPFGDPEPGKPGDTVMANAISKLCASKKEEHQFNDKGANALWLDLQDGYSWGLALNAGDAHPFVSFNGLFTSGAVWYALYGWKGAPILEQGSGGPQLVTPMGHDGRFALSGKVSAVITTFPRSLMLLEHPSPIVRLGKAFRRLTMGLPWARAELSICEWEPGLVKATVETQKRTVLAMATAGSQCTVLPP